MTSRAERKAGIRATGEMNGRRFAEHIRVSHSTVKRWLVDGMPATRSLDGDQQVWIDPEAAKEWIAVRFNGRKTIAFDRRAVVYFMQREDGSIKIGFSSDVIRRLHEIRRDNRSAVELLACFPGLKPDEVRLHARFAKHCIGDEWYSPADEILAFIASLGRSAA